MRGRKTQVCYVLEREMSVAHSTHRVVAVSQLPVALGRRLRPPSGWAEPPARPQAALGAESSATRFGLRAELLPHGPQKQEPTPLTETQDTGKNLLSVRAAFRRAGFAAESASNPLSNYIMERGTNYCLFPAPLETSFRGFILPLNHFSSCTLFPLLKSHF